MAIVALKCPHCGGNLEMEDSREFGFCQYCGTKIIIQDETVNNITNYTTINNNYLQYKETSGQHIYPILTEGHYEGPLVNGKPHGKGIFFWPGGVRYEGDFVNGVIEGYGRKTYIDGYYEGEFHNNLRHGHGKNVQDDGVVVEGIFKEDKQTGHFHITGRNKNGLDYTFDGECVDGSWRSGKISWSNGESFEGNWVNGKWNGHGIHHYPSGDWFEGNWIDGEIDGPGTHHYKNGNYYNGIWKNGKRIKYEHLHTPKGTTYSSWDDKGNPTGHLFKRILNGD